MAKGHLINEFRKWDDTPDFEFGAIVNISLTGMEALAGMTKLTPAQVLDLLLITVDIVRKPVKQPA